MERPTLPSSRAFCTVRRGTHTHEAGSAHGLRSRTNSLGSPEIKTPTVRIATDTHATRASRSQRPCKLIPRPCSFALFVTTPLYSTTVSRTLRQTLRGEVHEDIRLHQLPTGAW